MDESDREQRVSAPAPRLLLIRPRIPSNRLQPRQLQPWRRRRHKLHAVSFGALPDSVGGQLVRRLSQRLLLPHRPAIPRSVRGGLRFSRQRNLVHRVRLGNGKRPRASELRKLPRWLRLPHDWRGAAALSPGYQC